MVSYSSGKGVPPGGVAGHLRDGAELGEGYDCPGPVETGQVGRGGAGQEERAEAVLGLGVLQLEGRGAMEGPDHQGDIQEGLADTGEPGRNCCHHPKVTRRDLLCPIGKQPTWGGTTRVVNWHFSMPDFINLAFLKMIWH